MGRLTGKVAMVTGATSGFGEAIALLFAREGAKVVAAGLAPGDGDAIVSQIQANGGECIYVDFDVSVEAGWATAMATTMESYGKLNILVNNAGIASGEGSMDMSFELWRKIQSVNLDGTFLGTKYAIQTIRRCGEPGSIINMSSIMSRVGNKISAAYCASKGGIAAFTRAAAMHCTTEKLPIRVNSVHPGTCETPLVKSYYATRPAAERKAQEQRHPIGHFGEPNDIAYAVLYLASDESKFVVGSELVVDGGFLASDGIPPGE
jgi:3(or 17)beta-hydroxysteroid dehydrogenase